LVQGIKKGLREYKEENIIRPRCASSEILRNTSISSIYIMLQGYVWDWIWNIHVHVQYWIKNHETWNELFLNDMILVETRFDVLHLFYLLSIMMWVCLKSGIETKFWVKICKSICRFVLANAHVHAGSTPSSSVYKKKSFCSHVTNLSNQFFFVLLLSINEVFLDLNVELLYKDIESDWLIEKEGCSLLLSIFELCNMTIDLQNVTDRYSLWFRSLWFSIFRDIRRLG